MDVIGDIKQIPTPFAMYVGNSKTKAQAKVASGTIEWASHKVACVISDSNSLFELPNVGIPQAKALGVKTLVIGCAPFGGKIDEGMDTAILQALALGLNVASAMHTKLSSIERYVDAARKSGVKLYDFRHRDESYPLGTGEKREGIRLLTVGTDSSCGKKFTTLSIYQELKQIWQNTVFCSTGQTGFLISNCGINNDTIVADFLAGAAEYLSPSCKDAIYLIEGQGAMTHPAYTGGSMSLLAGSQPDYLILCHAWNRQTQLGVKRKPDIEVEWNANIRAAEIHGLSPWYVGISLNFSETDLTIEEQDEVIRELSKKYQTLVFDPIRHKDIVKAIAVFLKAKMQEQLT